MKRFISEFKTFAMRGNVIDLAVGMIIGGAFGKITSSLVGDLIMPLISLLLGGASFENWAVVLRPAVLDADGVTVLTEALCLNYGLFLSAVLDFVILAFAIFCMVRAINALHDRAKPAQEPEPEAAAPPAPTQEELLAEIRDLLKEKR